MKHYKHLSPEQRYTIAALHRKHVKQARIAEIVEVSETTVCRELKRNSNSLGHYSARDAQMFADMRRQECRRPEVVYPSMWDEIAASIRRLHCSPDCARGAMLKAGKVCCSVARIYQLIHWDKARGGDLWSFLPHRLKYRRRLAESYNYKGCIKNRLSIDERPPVVASRARFGDWELDLIVGPGNKGVVVVLVERLSKRLLMAPCRSKNADDVARVVVRLLSPFARFVHTITTDNGTEFAAHETISCALNALRPRGMEPVCIYFCHPYSSWEKGLVENTNKLIRQFIPKDTDLRALTPARLLQVQTLLNLRPRKKLNYNTPKSEFFIYLSSQNCT